MTYTWQQSKREKPNFMLADKALVQDFASLNTLKHINFKRNAYYLEELI